MRLSVVNSFPILYRTNIHSKSIERWYHFSYIDFISTKNEYHLDIGMMMHRYWRACEAVRVFSSDIDVCTDFMSCNCSYYYSASTAPTRRDFANNPLDLDCVLLPPFIQNVKSYVSSFSFPFDVRIDLLTLHPYIFSPLFLTRTQSPPEISIPNLRRRWIESRARQT